jgi:hypothetical protein
MPDKTTSVAEELRKLPPEERLKRAKEMEEQRKRELDKRTKELEEEKKMVELDLAQAEELLKETIEELDERAEDERKEREKKREEDEQSLDTIVQQERPAETEPPKQYGTDLYHSLERAATDLNELYRIKSWNEQQQQTYQQSKAQIERAQRYELASERLQEELGLASGILNRLKYRM